MCQLSLAKVFVFHSIDSKCMYQFGSTHLNTDKNEVIGVYFGFLLVCHPTSSPHYCRTLLYVLYLQIMG